jgi:SAM-dependent methyltransferase
MATTTDPAKRTGATQGDLWSERAADWAELLEPGMRPLFETGLAALGVAADTSLLDAGCGAGLALTIAFELGAAVSGLDAAPGLIAIARRRLADVRIEHGDLEELPFPDRTFDAVTGFNSFQYAASPEAALREARRVLRPGGRLLAAVWAPPELCELAGYLAAVGSLLPPPPPGQQAPARAVRAVRRRCARSADGSRRTRARRDARRVLPLRLRERARCAARPGLGRARRPRRTTRRRGRHARGRGRVDRPLPAGRRQLPDRQRLPLHAGDASGLMGMAAHSSSSTAKTSSSPHSPLKISFCRRCASWRMPRRRIRAARPRCGRPCARGYGPRSSEGRRDHSSTSRRGPGLT